MAVVMLAGFPWYEILRHFVYFFLVSFMTFLLANLSRYWLFSLILLWTMVSVLSLWPLPHLPSIPGSDKTHHIIAYGLLIFPVALRRPKYWRLIALLIIIWGGCIELLQPHVNRHAEWMDFLANSCGVLLGIIAATLVRSYIALSEP